MDFHSQFPLTVTEQNFGMKMPKKLFFKIFCSNLDSYSKKRMLNLFILFILMYLFNELAKNYLKSLFFNFFNVFFVIAYWGSFGNKSELLSIIFLI